MTDTCPTCNSESRDLRYHVHYFRRGGQPYWHHHDFPHADDSPKRECVDYWHEPRTPKGGTMNLTDAWRRLRPNDHNVTLFGGGEERDLLDRHFCAIPAPYPTGEALAAERDEMLNALRWCSGSPDFNEGGRARQGWLKICAPLIDRALIRDGGEAVSDTIDRVIRGGEME